MADLLTLRYHNSFIDVDEGSAIPSLSHVKSLPVLDRASPWGDDPDEAGRSLYVEDLWHKMEEKRQSEGVMVPSDDKLEGTTAHSDLISSPHSEVYVPSFGSLGHPEVCQRPCIYFQSGLCQNGSACNYCHLFHSEKFGKLDKKQRTLLQGLSYEEFVVFILPFIQEQIKQMEQIHLDASELLPLLQAAAAEANLPLMPARETRNISKVFTRMNLSSLIAMVEQKGRQQSNPPRADPQQHLDAVMERIRNDFIPKEWNLQEGGSVLQLQFDSSPQMVGRQLQVCWVSLTPKADNDPALVYPRFFSLSSGWLPMFWNILRWFLTVRIFATRRFRGRTRLRQVFEFVWGQNVSVRMMPFVLSKQDSQDIMFFGHLRSEFWPTSDASISAVINSLVRTQRKEENKRVFFGTLINLIAADFDDETDTCHSITRFFCTNLKKKSQVVQTHVFLLILFVTAASGSLLWCMPHAWGGWAHSDVGETPMDYGEWRGAAWPLRDWEVGGLSQSLEVLCFVSIRCLRR